ncbi:KRAB-A domain-containing protein 2-like [Melanaphis sacchari]|uniref:KRAB-A domain-containing protein 2-like n=1 Tax=Melanaphis sacchari TaxID=742174 RepID=UPI000DC14CA8|nr:KRAB-A domain-containing protein 2-like [Melanaphis sacchari]
MIKELQCKYKNITYEIVMLYLSLCIQCQTKQKAPRKGIVVKPIISSELNSRCQIDLVDMQTCKDGEYKFILNYQDHLTKFIQLRPLKSKTAEEVAHNLLHIFLTFGAPNILHSDNGREFVNKIITELCLMWDGVKIVHGKPRHSQTQGSIERANQDIQNLLRAWMYENNTNKWADGLYFVQFTKNTAYHEGIKQSPYEAMFGTKAKMGLFSSSLPRDKLHELESEEHLENIIKNMNSENIDRESLQESSDADQHDNNNTDSENIDRESLQESSDDEQHEKKMSNKSISRRKEKIILNREVAITNLQVQAVKMLRTSKQKFQPANVGETVRIRVPDVDRSKMDPQNILAVVY